MSPDTIVLTIAEGSDLDQIVALYDRSRAVGLPFVPRLHSLEADRAFLARFVASAELIVACRDGRLAGFMVHTGRSIAQLYLEPDLRGQGIGRRLVDRAKAGSEALELWCFADNHAARAFYAAQGFSEIGGTDGDNEEGLPDIFLRWQRQPNTP